MPFTKNDTRINRQGRPAGSKNKNELRDILTEIIGNELENINETLESLDPKERLDFIAKILPYALPKLTSTTIENESEPWAGVPKITTPLSFFKTEPMPDFDTDPTAE